MPTDPLTDYLDAAAEAARRAAAVLDSWRDRFRIHTKARFDLVTDADLEAQRAVREYLHQRFPEHAFLGEEEATAVHPGPDAPPTWIVDPLDGTTNYVHGYPVYAVSVGLQVRGELVVGAICDPPRQELFTAARGHGAWLGGRRLQTTETAHLKHALLANEAPYELPAREATLDQWRRLMRQAQGQRQTGSTVLDLAHVAAGRLDGYWAVGGTKPWDVAAGVVLIREAGGVVTHADGSPFDPFTPDVVASNGPLHPVLLQALSPARRPV